MRYVVPALLALAIAAPPAAAQSEAAYGLANGCYTLRAANGQYAAKADDGAYRLGPRGEPFRMQATRLGQFLLYGSAGDFVSGEGGTVRSASTPDGTADWRVEGDAGAFRLSLPDAAGAALAADGDRLVTRSGGGDTFSFEAAEGCAVYPEVEVNVSGEPYRPPTPFGVVRGTVEGHMHWMAFEFLGGSIHCGRPWHPYGAAFALVDCPDHFTGAAPLETVLGGRERHDPVGWPTFRDWPDDQSLTHETSYYKWVERAWRGGLRLFVNLLVDNAVLCELYPLKRNSCNEMDGVRLQARRLRELQDYVDAQYGGPGKGWLRIVTDPFEARRVIAEGKLAVIMGIEVSKLFDCGLNNDAAECTKEQIDQRLDEVHGLGVRQMELINKFDNALGGVAGDAGTTGVVTNNGNKYETGKYWELQTCDGDPQAQDNEQITPHQRNEDKLISNGLAAFLPAGQTPIYPAAPHCNVRGLSELGRHLVNRMMDRGMIVDPDHLSVIARNHLLDTVEARDYSGVISSHSWSTPDSYPRIYKLGGFITPYAGGSTGFVEKWRDLKRMADRRYYWGISYGADMNGFGSQGTPRGADVENPVTYPFRSLLGEATIDKQRSGERVYDINADGVDHYGLYPDWIEDLRKQAGDEIVEDMTRGAEAYLQMWERAVGVPRTRCRGAHLGFTSRGLGGAQLGAGPEALLRSATQPRTRAPRAWQWCVEAKDGIDRGERTAAVFTPAGTVALVASTGAGHVFKGVGPGTRARRARAKTRRFGKRLLVRRAARGSGARVVFVLRKRRVALVAVATRDVAAKRASLRRYLRLSGLL